MEILIYGVKYLPRFLLGSNCYEHFFFNLSTLAIHAFSTHYSISYLVSPKINKSNRQCTFIQTELFHSF